MAAVILELLAAAGGVALAIIGLAGAAPGPLSAIAITVLGVGFLLERWAADTLHAELLPDGGLAWASIAGGAGIVLGVRSLLRPDWGALAIALILFGMALALSPWPNLAIIRVLAGLGAVVLGALVIGRIGVPTLVLVDSIVVGSALALAGCILPGARRRRGVGRGARAATA